MEHLLETNHLNYQEIRDILRDLYYFGWSPREYERILSHMEYPLEANHLNSMAIISILIPLIVLVLSVYSWEEGYSSSRAEQLHERMLFFIEQLLKTDYPDTQTP